MSFFTDGRLRRHLEIVEKELAAAIEQTHARAGTVLVQDPSNGEILAMASWPKFNPNAPGGSPAEARMNRAIGLPPVRFQPDEGSRRARYLAARSRLLGLSLHRTAGSTSCASRSRSSCS